MMNNGEAVRIQPVREQGLALIELMIAMVLGLVIMGAVAGVMLSNNQSFRSTRAVAQIQDSVRVGYELLARDIRQAGNMPCGTDIEVVNILKGTQGDNTDWQYDWGKGIVGVSAEDSLKGVDRVDGTEALILMHGDAGDVFMDSYDKDNNSANFTVATSSGKPHGILPGEILLVCNEKQGTIFQVNSNQGGGNSGASNVIVVNTGNGSPGNCTKGLGPLIIDKNGKCDNNGNRGDYNRNTVVAKLSSVAWYIGDNNRIEEGGRSLYMTRLGTKGEDAELNRIEVASGVVDMKLRYRLIDTSNFVDAGSVTESQWADVNAVEITLKLDSQDQNISTDRATNNGRLSRELTSIVAIRNRSL